MQKNGNRVVSVLLCGLLVFESVVQSATGQGSGGTLPTTAAAQSGAAQSGEARARWLADHQAWREYQLRHPTSVFSFEQLSSIFAEQRDIERFVDAFTITQELSAGWRDSLRRAAQETESDNLYTDVVEIQEAYEELAAEYDRLAAEANERGAGLLGMVASLAVNIVVSAIPGAGPVLGSAVAGGFNKAINGGSFGEVLFAMGLAAGASFVAQEVSESILEGAPPATAGSAGPSQATINLANAGGSVAAFPVSQAGTEFLNVLFTAPSRSFSPKALPAAADTRARPMVVHRTPDLDQVVEGALRQLSPGVSGAGAAPGAAVRPDAEVGAPQANRARSLSDRVWAARQVQGGFQPALSGDSLLVIHAMQREIERPVVAYQILQELHARARRGLDRMARETEAINLSDDRDTAVEAYEDLLAEYQQLQEDIRNRGGGLLGAIGSLVGSVIGTVLGGPFLGAAFAGAIGAIANGGHVGEALVMAGFNVGATYAYSVTVPALHNVLVGSPAAAPNQTSLDEMIDKELADELASFYVDPVLEASGNERVDQGAGTGTVIAHADGSGSSSDVLKASTGDVGATDVADLPPHNSAHDAGDAVKPLTLEEKLTHWRREDEDARAGLHSPDLHPGQCCANDYDGPTIGPTPPLTPGQRQHLISSGIPPNHHLFNRESFELLRFLTLEDIQFLRFYGGARKFIENVHTIQQELGDRRRAVERVLRDLRTAAEPHRRRRRR